MSDDGYPIPAGLHRTDQTIERSRFIATIAHTPTPAAARALIDAMRAEFADATHNCWAFVAGPPASTAHIGLSDAGEPHGTAGRPMLDVLLHSGIGEVGAVVTRYFGGVKLGKGGLVRAYGGAVQHALATLPTRLRIERVTFAVSIPYGDVELLKRVLTDFDAETLEENYSADVRYVAAVPASRSDAFVAALADGTAGRASIAAHD